MLKNLFFVFAGLLVITLAIFVFRFFYLKGLLSFNPNVSFLKPRLSPAGESSPPPLSPEISVRPENSPEASPVQKGKLVRIEVDDNAAGRYSISVKKETMVELTLIVVPENVFHGGIDFRSPVISTGVILPGSSKIVKFVAENSFELVPYYADSGLPAPYRIRILVEEI
jgi:hypothetical protein